MVERMGVIRILLADDHPVVREGIRNRLDGEDDCLVVGEAVNGDEAVSLALHLCPDVVLLDVAMPGPGVVPVLEVLRQKVPAAKVLVVSAFDDDKYIFGTLAAGAAGYALKGERLSTLVEAVRTIARGEAWLSPSRGMSSPVRTMRGRWLPASGETSRTACRSCLLAMRVSQLRISGTGPTARGRFRYPMSCEGSAGMLL